MGKWAKDIEAIWSVKEREKKKKQDNGDEESLQLAYQ